MTPHDLIAAFDMVAEDPDGVERLREIILQLAVRGRLVPQDPTDEPASVLLERIAAEKARLAKTGKLLRRQLLPPVSAADTSFVVPQGWAWSRLRDLFIKITDGTHHSPPNGPSGAFKYVTAKNIKYYGVDLKDITYVSAPVHEEIFTRCDPEAGDILYVKDGATTGVITINDLDEPFSLLSSVGLLKPGGLINARYAYWAMRSPFFYEQTRNQMAGVAITRVTLDKLNMACLPLPPLAEQQRIVARVDELMCLLDRLEAARTTCEATRAATRDSMLAALREADTTDEVEVAWNRLTERMDDLLCEPTDIVPLRQTVLQLAVRGKLVPQDPADEPASALLERIAAEKARLVKAGKIRKQAAQAPVGDTERPFGLPPTWAWCRAGGLFQSITSGSRGWATHYAQSGPVFLRIGNLDYGTTRLDLAQVQRVQPPAGEESRRTAVRPGDVLVSITGDPGMVGLVPADLGPAHISQHVAACRPLPGVAAEFVAMAFTSPHVLDQHWSNQRGVKNSLGLEDIANLRVGVPPLAEQHRIVARVDELMGLLDRLEARLTAARTAHAAFAAAAVHHLDV